MSRILEASCLDSKVTIDGKEINVDLIIGAGIGASTGVLILDGSKSYYVAKTNADFHQSLNSLVDAIGKIADLFTAIGAGMTGGSTAPPGTLVADVAAIDALATTLNTLKGNLK